MYKLCQLNENLSLYQSSLKQSNRIIFFIHRCTNTQKRLSITVIFGARTNLKYTSDKYAMKCADPWCASRSSSRRTFRDQSQLSVFTREFNTRASTHCAFVFSQSRSYLHENPCLYVSCIHICHNSFFFNRIISFILQSHYRS